VKADFLPAERDADNIEAMAQAIAKVSQLQPFIAVFPQECMGQLTCVGPT
jgi:hypothetical protein